VKANIRNSRQS